MSLPQPLLAALKEPRARGTWEDDATAFQLGVGRARLPPLFGSPLFPYLAAPTLGSYGEDYVTAPPIVALALEPRAALGAPRRAVQAIDDLLRGGILAADGLAVAVLVHSGLQRQACLACGDAGCVNLVLHAWAFSRDLADEADAAADDPAGGAGGEAGSGHQRRPPPPPPDLVAEVLVGVYDGRGVEPVHPDFGGGPLGPLPWERLSSRVVHCHDGRFSPNNCQLRLSPDAAAAWGPLGGARASGGGGGTDGSGGCGHGAGGAPAPPPPSAPAAPDGRDRADVVSFISLAVDPATHEGALTLHVAPVGDAAADWVRGWVRGAGGTLGGLLQALQAHLPAVHHRLHRMLLGAHPPGEDEGEGAAPGGAGGRAAAGSCGTPPPAGPA